jgi:hypothetical protein
MKTMEIKSKLAVHNFFEIEVRDAETNELRETARAENIVLNEYFRALANGHSGGSYESYMCVGICFGRGTGTLSRTRTSLFDQIARRAASLVSYVPATPTWAITREITLGVTEFNGEVITEVGFWSAYDRTVMNVGGLSTHALLQDSEGNPITITKTDTDIVIIRGTFFVTLTAGTGLGANGAYNVALTSRLAAHMTGKTCINWRQYLMGRWPVDSVIELTNEIEDLSEAEWNANKLPYIRRITRTNSAEEASRASSQTLWDVANMTITIPLRTFSDTAYPNQVFRCIGGMGGVINLPDHDFFPPFHVAGKNIGSGDGTTVDFNIGVPVIMPNTETIYVDSVPQVKGTDYLIEYDNNCVDMYENFFSCQYSVFSPNIEFGDAKTATPTDSTSTFLIDPLLWSQSGSLRAGGKCKLPQNINITEDNPAWFDFLEPKRCNLFKVVGPTVPAGQIANMVIQYSTDNTIWNNVPNLVRNAQVWTWDMTEARYWRIYIPSYTWVYPLRQSDWGKSVNGINFYATFFLGAQTPGLKFLTAPALNAVITADFDIDVIFKTTNNVLRFQWAIEVGFGEGS